jgi:hypothetical protein
MARAMYDYGENPNDFPAYMSIYKNVCDICREQRSIIDGGADLLLSSVFCALPLLKEVRLSFCEALSDDQCLVNPDIIKEEPYRYHLEAVTNAIRNARRRDIVIHAISLVGFELPYMQTWEESSLNTVTLRRLLEGMTVLRLRGSGCILKLLAHDALGIHQLDMCRMTATDTALMDFLQANKKTIRSIGFHDAEIYKASPPLTSNHPMTANTLCTMLGVPPSTLCRADHCCLPWRKEGSRLVIGAHTEDRLQLCRVFAKRKLDDL